MKRTFFGILLICCSAACAAPPPVKFSAFDCYIRYLVPEGQLYVEANLSENTPGEIARHPVTAPDGMQYLGVRMNTVSNDGKTTYTVDRPGGYSPNHSFTWKDAAGTARSFEMSMQPISAFSFGTGGEIDRNTPATLQWDGAPLETGEGLILLWERAEGRLTVTMEVTGTPGRKSIDFPAAKLKELAPGEWTLYLVRKKVVRTKSDTGTANGLVEFFTRVDTLRVR